MLSHEARRVLRIMVRRWRYRRLATRLHANEVAELSEGGFIEPSGSSANFLYAPTALAIILCTPLEPADD